MNERLANLINVDARFTNYIKRLTRSLELGYIDCDEHNEEVRALRTLQRCAARREARMRDEQFMCPRFAINYIAVSNYAGLYNFAPGQGLFIVDDFGNFIKLPDREKYRNFYKYSSPVFYGEVRRMITDPETYEITFTTEIAPYEL